MTLSDVSIILPALVAGLLVLSTHVPLGREVVKRGVIFIDLAIAQFACVGIVIAKMLDVDAHGWTLQIIALSSALLGSAGLMLLERYVQQHQEAFIGVSFVLAATAIMLLLAGNPHGNEQLQYLLLGQILWVEWTMLGVPAVASALILALWFWKPAFVNGRGFYLCFAVAVTLSVQLIGVYLVFASLIIPALALVERSHQAAAVQGMVLSALAYLTGLLLSTLYDLPAGALIVWCLAIYALILPPIFRRLWSR